MKNMKKIASLLLALALILSLAIPAFAAGNGSITIEKPINGLTYTAHKIFDVVYSGTNFAYSINTGNEWYTDVAAYAATAEKGLTLTASASDAATYVVTIDDTKFSAPDFAAYLRDKAAGKAGIETIKATSNDKIIFDGLDLGYYFVHNDGPIDGVSKGALCNLTTTAPSTTIYDKNNQSIEKTTENPVAGLGEVVPFTITTNVPDTTGFKTYKFVVSDTMTEGLTYQKDLVIKVNGTVLTSNYTITREDSQGFSVSIDVMNLQADVQKDIVLTYTAVVNEKAVATVSTNKASLEYSNNPENESSTEKIETPPEEVVTVITSKLVIDKYVKGEETNKLAGAQFVLYKEVEGTKLYYKLGVATNDAGETLLDGEGNEIPKAEWVADIAEADVKTTGDNGAAEFIGLDNGDYSLLEIEAPAGYNKLTAPVAVTVAGNPENVTTLTVNKGVENSAGSILPSTGGMGTTLFYTIGGLMMLAAVVLLATKKRMYNAG